MRALIVGLAAAACAACSPLPNSGPVGGGEHAPAEGRYTYRGAYIAPGAAEPRVFRGMLYITEARDNRIGGRWEVTGFEPPLQLGSYSNGGYDVDAEVIVGVRGSFKHRIARGEGSALTCSGTFVGRVDGQAFSYPATCSLTYVDPNPDAGRP